MARRLIVALCLAACAHARSGPPVITPQRGEAREAPRDLSQGGTQRGAIEYVLGGVTAGLTATLITLGAVQLTHAREIADYCEIERKKREELLASNAFAPPIDPACEPSPLGIDPYTEAKISSGLAFAFAAPIAVASGFLFRRAVRIQRDYRAFQRAFKATSPTAAVTPFAGRQGGGLRLEIRF